MALALIKTAAKVGIGAGAVYITMDHGVWGNSHQAATTLQQVRTRYLTATNDYINRMPPATTMNEKAVDTWNNGVQKVFTGIAASPEYIGHYSKKTYSQLKKQLLND